MHAAHHEGMLHHDVGHAAEDDPKREEEGLAPRDAALHLVVMHHAEHVGAVYRFLATFTLVIKQSIITLI